MPTAYSKDLREKILLTIEQGQQSKPTIADSFKVSNSFVYALWSRYQKTGKIEAKRRGGNNPPKIDQKGEDHLREWLANEPDLTLNELCHRYTAHFSISVSKSALDRTLKRMKMTYKKKSLRS